MTIGIGVLASEKSKPDTAILLADTRGSFGDEYSMNRLHKIFVQPEDDFYAAAADRVDRAAEAIPIIATELRQVPQRSYGDIVRGITKALLHYKTERFAMSVLPRIWNTKDEMLGAQMPENIRKLIDEEWKKFPLNFELVVAAFDHAGQAFLFVIGEGWLENFSFPGFAAIGSGAGNAMFWLSYRNHHLGRSVKNSAYHAFEAKIMAESSPFVNEKIDLLIATKGNHVMISDFKPAPAAAPFTIGDLRQLFLIYGPKNTDELTPAASQKL
jgi:hypothetical protein